MSFTISRFSIDWKPIVSTISHHQEKHQKYWGLSASLLKIKCYHAISHPKPNNAAPTNKSIR